MAEREVVWLDSRASSRFRVERKLRVGGIVLAQYAVTPSEGGCVTFSGTTAAIHEGTPIKMVWRVPETGRVRSNMVGPGDAMVAAAGVPVWKRWSAPRRIFALTMEESFFDRVRQGAFGDRAERHSDGNSARRPCHSTSLRARTPGANDGWCRRSVVYRGSGYGPGCSSHPCWR